MLYTYIYIYILVFRRRRPNPVDGYLFFILSNNILNHLLIGQILADLSRSVASFLSAGEGACFAMVNSKVGTKNMKHHWK